MSGCHRTPRLVRKAARTAYRFTLGLLPQLHRGTELQEAEPQAEPADPLREREEELLLALPELVRAGDRIALVRDDLLPGDALAAILAETAAVLRDAGLPFVVVSDRAIRHRLAISPGDRAAVLAACAKAFCGMPVYADLLGHGRTLSTVLAESLPEAVADWEGPDRPDAAAADGLPEESEGPEERRERVKGARLYRPVVTSGGTLHYGSDYGCDLEFWDSAAPSRGAVAAIAETPYGWWVPSLEAAGSVRIAGADYPVAAAFVNSFPDDIEFPVDAVVTWVDDADPAWQRRRAEARAGSGSLGVEGTVLDAPSRDDDDHRYHNRDELRYCLRSIAMYAPWIRRIFLVTDGQVPPWLDTTRLGVTVVFHSELFEDSTRAVFNSHAIEAQLHRIPGLAEHFLYFNDDMFLGRPLQAEDFFVGNGLPIFFRDGRIIPPGEPEVQQDDIYVAAQQTTRMALECRTGRTFTQVLSHVPYPLRRSLLAETAERWADELAVTSRSAFRSGTDVAPVTLATYYAYLTGRAVSGRITHEYLAIDRHEDLVRLQRLLESRGTDVICLADGSGEEISRAEQDRAVVGFLQAYFPVPGPYERTPAPTVIPKPADQLVSR